MSFTPSGARSPLDDLRSMIPARCAVIPPLDDPRSMIPARCAVIRPLDALSFPSSSERLNLAKDECVITNGQVMTNSPLTGFAPTRLTPGPYGALRGRARHPAALPGDPIHTSKVQQRFGASVRMGCKASG
jgi:hypothetical protein